MSLRAFHIVFVTLSSLLAFVFAGWNLRGYAAAGSVTHLTLGAASGAFGLLLIAYGFWFWRKIRTREEENGRRRKILRKLPALALVYILGTRVASACSVCYGEAEGPMIDAARLGVFLLFGLVFAVQLGFVLFFIHLRRRAKRYAAATEA
jgi:hypothetical protein